MTLTYGLSSVRHLFAKLQRDAALLGEEVTSDRFFNFVVTGYSMIDWVKNDPSVPAAARTAPALDGLRDDQWLKVCGDLAIASKHFTLTLRKAKAITASADSSRGYGVGRDGKGAYGVGEESIEVQLSDGTSLRCLDLVTGVVSTWKTFFTTQGV
jgi:hypothetical protein